MTSKCTATFVDDEWTGMRGQEFKTDCGHELLYNRQTMKYKYCPYCGKPFIVDTKPWVCACESPYALEKELELEAECREYAGY